ncbi:hypothetical protein ACHAXT_006169 [Thalassiosira profunda]
MLNEGKGIDGEGGSAESGGEEDMSTLYSLVSEAKSVGDASNGGVDAGNQSKEASDGANLGLLILEGLEADDDDTEVEEEEKEEEEEEVEDSNQGTPLSIPDTVYLPSEVGSMGAVSGVTHEQNRHRGCGNADSRYHRVRGILSEKWSLLLSSVPRWRAGAARSFNSTQLLSLLAMCMAFAAFTSWRSQVWRNEALRLEEKLQQQRTLLAETQAQLEVMLEWNEQKGSGKSDFEGSFPHHNKQSDDEAVLSFKNCYVEASISLGACSRDWQRRWWSDGKSGSSRGPEDEEDDIFSYDDGFADDMHRLVTSFKDTVASKTTRSYSYVQKAMKELSYEGLKDTFTKDGYIQSILQFPPPEMNGTGDRTRIAAI